MSFIDEVFGSIPQVAPYFPTLYSEEIPKSLQEDIAAFPKIDQLGSLYENYMLDAFQSAGMDIKSLIEGGTGNVAEMEKQAQSMLEGKVPKDVQDQIRRQDALTSMLSGGPGGAAGLTARDLGLTSLNLISQGGQLAGQAGNAAQRWAGLASGLIMSPSGFLVTPQQQAQLTMQNRLYEQATQQLRYNLAARPDPALQALNQWIEQVGGTVVGSYLGGGMGGMGGGGKGGGSYMTSYQTPADASSFANALDTSAAGLTTPAGPVTSSSSSFTSGGGPNINLNLGTGANTGNPLDAILTGGAPQPQASNLFDQYLMSGGTPTGTTDFLSGNESGSNLFWGGV